MTDTKTPETPDSGASLPPEAGGELPVETTDETAHRGGRPRKAPEERMGVRAMVNMTEALGNEVRDRAEAAGMDKAEWLRALVEWAVQTGWTPPAK